MSLRATWYGTALLLAGLALSSGVTDLPWGSGSSERAAGRVASAGLTHGSTDPSGVVVVPMPGFRALAREVAGRGRQPGRGAAAVTRTVVAGPVSLPLFRITPFANPESAAAAACSRAGSCSAFATTQPPPVRA